MRKAITLTGRQELKGMNEAFEVLSMDTSHRQSIGGQPMVKWSEQWAVCWVIVIQVLSLMRLFGILLEFACTGDHPMLRIAVPGLQFVLKYNIGLLGCLIRVWNGVGQGGVSWKMSFVRSSFAKLRDNFYENFFIQSSRKSIGNWLY